MKGRIVAIDVWMSWPSQTENKKAARSDEAARISAHAGDLGHLCEAYHGAPYVLMYFLREGFGEDPQALLDSLSATFGPALQRLQEMGVGTEGPPISFDGYQTDFGPDDRVTEVQIYSEEDEGFYPRYIYPAAVLRERLPIASTIANYKGDAICKTGNGWPDMVDALTSFVELAERLEGEGKGPATLNVSY